MKKLLAALAVVFVLLAPMSARAIDRTQHLTGLNPPSTWLNMEQRDVRVGFGTALWMMLAGNNASYGGTYSNCTVSPVTGLYVAVATGTAVTNCSVYQLLAEETAGYGGYPSGVGTFLPPDTTQVVLQGLLPAGTTTANIGPMAVGTSTGQSISNLIECKVVTSDTTSQTVNIVSSGGSVTSTNANRDRVDRLSCQFKSSSSAISPTTPTVDAGYVAIAAVVVPFGTVTVTSGMVTAQTPFYGFAPLTASGATAIDTSSTAQTKAGALTLSNGLTIFTTTFSNNVSPSGLNLSGALGVNGLLQANNLVVNSAYSPSTGDIGLAYTGSPTNSGRIWFGNALATAGYFGYDGTNYGFHAVNGGTALVTIGSSTGNTTAYGWLVAGSSTAATVSAGDVAASRTTNSGLISIGGSGTQATLDFGVTTSGKTTLSTPLNVTGNTSVTGVVFASSSIVAGTTSGFGYGAAGDMYASEGASAGRDWIGGSTTAGGVDWNINNTNAISLKTAAGAYAPVFGGTYTPSSDRRWKRDIHDTAYGLDAIMQLRPRDFRWRADGRADTGFIAQEVKPVLPELVSRDKRGYYGFEYSNLTAVLTKAVQEQQHEIEALRIISIGEPIAVLGLGVGLVFCLRRRNAA